MKPTFIHNWVADGGPIKMVLGIGAVGGPIFIWWFCAPSLATLRDPGFLLVFLLAFLFGTPFAIIMAPLVFSIPLAIIDIIFSRMNGYPFNVGDKVMILSKKHRGYIGPIRSVHEESKRVSVHLSPEAKLVGQDDFSYTQVIKL
ncbi:MAG: hypothetical protein SFY92_03610 [Verrucomicrobiae bacterium]|nr:hypothetical protein [Verrucomicrobiae bacterium]